MYLYIIKFIIFILQAYILLINYFHRYKFSYISIKFFQKFSKIKKISSKNYINSNKFKYLTDI